MADKAVLHRMQKPSLGVCRVVRVFVSRGTLPTDFGSFDSCDRHTNLLAYPDDPLGFLKNRVVKIWLILAGYDYAHFVVVDLRELLEVHRSDQRFVFVQVAFRVKVLAKASPD